METIEESKQILSEKLPSVTGILDKKTGRKYLKGENPYYDMQIDNYILCPQDVLNWYGFVKSNYELF